MSTKIRASDLNFESTQIESNLTWFQEVYSQLMGTAEGKSLFEVTSQCVSELKVSDEMFSQFRELRSDQLRSVRTHSMALMSTTALVGMASQKSLKNSPKFEDIQRKFEDIKGLIESGIVKKQSAQMVECMMESVRKNRDYAMAISAASKNVKQFSDGLQTETSSNQKQTGPWKPTCKMCGFKVHCGVVAVASIALIILIFMAFI